jgi:hypothetical protein
MVYPKANSNTNLTPLMGVEILSGALSIPASTLPQNSPTALSSTSQENADIHFGNCRRFDPDVGERFIGAKEATQCANKLTITETTVVFLTA